ncbi:hypothetical protein [Streptomyces mirabilis]
MRRTTSPRPFDVQAETSRLDGHVPGAGGNQEAFGSIGVVPGIVTYIA